MLSRLREIQTLIRYAYRILKAASWADEPTKLRESALENIRIAIDLHLGQWTQPPNQLGDSQQIKKTHDGREPALPGEHHRQTDCPVAGSSWRWLSAGEGGVVEGRVVRSIQGGTRAEGQDTLQLCSGWGFGGPEQIETCLLPDRQGVILRYIGYKLSLHILFIRCSQLWLGYQMKWGMLAHLGRGSSQQPSMLHMLYMHGISRLPVGYK